MAAGPVLEPEFVGESRRLLVEGLLELFDQRSGAGGGPLWVSLEAPAGWGKTRVVRELYGCLAAGRQREPAYWPGSILGAASSGVGGVAQRRKRVFPERVDRAAGSLPDWFWWGITCSERNGVPSQALVADLTQFEVHREFLDKAWRVRRSVFQRLGDEAKGAFGPLRRASVDEAVSMVLESGVASLVGSATGLGPVVALGRWFAGRVKEADVGREASTLQTGGAGVDIVDDVAAALVQLATDAVPLVVCVEDLHLADDLLLELLGRLVRSEADVLLLTTTWPGLVDDRVPLAALVAGVDAARVLRVRSDRPVPAGLPTGAGLGAFDPEDLAGVVRFYHPLVEDDTVRLLVEHYGQPLALELVCSLPWVQQVADSQQGRLRLEPDEVGQLPTEVEDVYRLWWAQLPEQVRQVLVLSAWAIPDSVLSSAEEPPVWGSDERWDSSVVAEVAAAVLPPVVDLAAAMGTSTAYAWVRHVDDLLRVFHEPPQRDVALTARGVLHPRARREFLTALATNLTQDTEARSSPSQTEEADHGEATANRARTLLALHAEGFLDDSTTSVDAVLTAYLTLVSRLLGLPRETRRVIDIATLGIELPERAEAESTGTVTGTRALLRWWRAVALRDVGGRATQGTRVLVAVDEWSSLLADHEAELGPDHPHTLNARSYLALAYQAAGDLARAVPAFEATLADGLRVLGPDHPDTLISRFNLAIAYLTAGDFSRAMREVEATLADMTRVLGRDHPKTLSSRHLQAAAYEAAGDLTKAVPAFEATLADRLRVLGPDHPHTLTSRHHLAGGYQRAGDLARAVPAHEALLADRLRVLGPDHPDTLASRNNLAVAYRVSGDLARAVSAHEALLTDRLRVLGPDNPDTLSSRNNLASAYRALGDLARAIPAYEAVLADRLRVLGPDNPNTLLSRHHLAVAYESAGDLTRAVPAYEATLADRLRVLGPDNPHTLTSRIDLAGAYQAAGDLTRAVAAYEAALADVVRVLGPDNPDTLTTRNNVAYAYLAAGDLARAVPAFEAVMADRLRVLGPDHPDTLSSRSNLADAYQAAGDLARAVPAYEAVLVDMERVLKPDHPLTLTCRNSLAVAYTKTGELNRAVSAHEATLAARLRVLGPENPDTLTSRNNLAFAYMRAGDLARAVPAYEAVLADRVRVLGSDNPYTLTSRNELASAYAVAGDLARAVPAYEAVLGDMVRVLGPDNPYTLTSRNELASAYAVAGDLARAVPAFEAVLGDMVRVLGPDHPTTLSLRSNLAVAYAEADDLPRAVDEFETVLSELLLRPGLVLPSGATVASVRRRLAGCLGGIGEHGRALQQYERLLDHEEDTLGPEHRDLLLTRWRIGDTLAVLGRTTQAREVLEDALAVAHRVLAVDDEVRVGIEALYADLTEA